MTNKKLIRCSRLKGANKENSIKKSINKFIELHKNELECEDRIKYLSKLIGKPDPCPTEKIRVLQLTAETKSWRNY